METFKDKEYLNLRGAIFQDLFNDKKFTDVVIETNDGTQFPCHKIILTGGSQFFQGLFRSDMIESKQKVINLKKIDISARNFKQILEYIYTGEIELNFEDAKTINIYSGLFALKNLKDFSENVLIKNLGNSTCLSLWRHAEKYLNDKLKDLCMVHARTNIFLDNQIYDFTMEEIKSIATMEKFNCTSITLVKNIVKWIKFDFENRKQYIKDLMELINFDHIENEFKRKIFSDELLIESKEFLGVTHKHLLCQLQKKNLFVVTHEKVFNINFDTKKFNPTSLCANSKWFAMSSHPTNGFVTTGGYQNNANINLCNQFSPSTFEIKELPKLIEARRIHKNYTLGSKMYACGGYHTNTVEVFEGNAGRWINGPAMLNDENYYFGSADDGENSLYAVGGNMDLITRLDTRVNIWQKIYKDSSIGSGFTKSFYKNNQIYGFGTSSGYIFDIRANKMLSNIPYNLDGTKIFSFFSQDDSEKHYTYYDCTIVEDDIWVVGNMCVDNEDENFSSIIKFNFQTNQWERQMFEQLPSTKVLGLVWCNNI